MGNEPSQEDIRTLAALFHAYFRGNDIQTKTVNDFEQEYNAEFALWWYSKENFFFSSVNKALRTFDRDTILAFRVFIRDIGELLHQDFLLQRDQGKLWENGEDIFVYRGQTISPDVLNWISGNEDELVSFTNFVSTSRKREVGTFFAESTQAISQGLEPALFEMRLSTRQPTKPFADVSMYSQFSNEDEILFIIGIIFRIDKVIKREKPEMPYTLVRLSLIGNADYDMREVVDHLKATRINATFNNQLANFASILEEMSEYGKAECYYPKLMNQISNDKSVRAACLDGHGTIALRNGKYADAIMYETEAVEIYENHEPRDLLHLAKKYNNLGMAYGASGNSSTARFHFQRSNELKYSLFHNDRHIDMADTFDNFGNCYEIENDFDQAEENFHRALAIRIGNNMPRRHPDFVKNYMSLGNVYGNKKMFEQVVLYHQKALDLARDVLPFDHPLLGVCYNNLRENYASMCNDDKAKDYFDKALKVYRCTYDTDHPEIKRTQDNITKIVNALSDYYCSPSAISVIISIIISVILPLYTYMLCE
ncbi:unnamed protein product [Rotaria sp. Silwood2]|nr:unnamed protein product [Rotaria sp. Silwood2]